MGRVARIGKKGIHAPPNKIREFTRIRGFNLFRRNNQGLGFAAGQKLTTLSAANIGRVYIVVMLPLAKIVYLVNNFSISGCISLNACCTEISPFHARSINFSHTSEIANGATGVSCGPGSASPRAIAA